MTINQTRIHNPEIYLSHVPALARFRLVADVTNQPAAFFSDLGFPDPLSHGQAILPRPRGTVSNFNANGDWVIHRDQPKEERYIRTVYWTRRQWAGRGRTEEVSDWRDIYRNCYPRDFIAPPSLELIYLEHGARRLVVSEQFVNDPDNRSQHKHAINLFLELFGACDIVTANLVSYTPSVVRRVNWALLPPGERLWQQLEDHIRNSTRRTSANTQRVIWDRQETLRSFNPEEIGVGVGGFNDYVAYIFRSRGLVVLESIRKDNAIYIFGLDWQRVSQLSKAEVLAEGVHLHRVIHAVGWKEQLGRILTSPPTVIPPLTRHIHDQTQSA